MVFEEGASSSKKVKIEEQKPLSRNHLFSVLVVDDDGIIRKIHSVILKSLGFKVEVAENGKDAVDLFRARANFHIVFMVMEMPVMSGIEATKELRAMGVESKIVGVTSSDLEIEKEAFLLAGLDVCYIKPLTMARLISLMEYLKNNYIIIKLIKEMTSSLSHRSINFMSS